MKKPIFDVEALWQIKRPSGLCLSPDGAQAVVTLTRYSMEKNTSSSSLQLLSTLGGKPRQLTKGDKDSQAQWAPDGEQICFVAKREQDGAKDSQPQLYVIDPAGGEARRVTSLATGVAAAKWFPDSKRVAFISWVWPDLKGEKAQAARLKSKSESKVKAHVVEHMSYRYWDHWLSSGQVPHLFVCEVQTGKCTDLFEGSAYDLSHFEPGAADFDISPDGKQICFAHDPHAEKRIDAEYQLFEIELKSKTVKALSAKVPLSLRAPAYSPDGKSIACLSKNSRKKHTELSRLSLIERGSLKHHVATQNWDRDVAAPLRWDADSAALYFLAEDCARVHLHRFELSTATPEVLVRGGSLTDFAVLENNACFISHSMQSPPAVFCKAADGEARAIEQFNAAHLSRFKFGRHEELYYDGFKDQFKAHAWVIYPPDFDPKKRYPLLHSIHGGPATASQDGWHFRWNNHAFAAQGYIVVCVNYHGSSSFGFGFKDSITNEWGKRELVDIDAATSLLCKRPYVDSDRVFATGGSYGGYMVAWMNAHLKKNRYKAYICHAGVFDWVSMFADDAYVWHAKELGAYYWDQPERVAKQNPLTYAATLKTPTLVIHGALDYRVPDGQGFQYFNTLKAQGVASKLVFFPDENHWILKPQNSKLWYDEYFAWLKRFDPKYLNS